MGNGSDRLEGKLDNTLDDADAVDYYSRCDG
jgi:hypothetical protein